MTPINQHLSRKRLPAKFSPAAMERQASKLKHELADERTRLARTRESAEHRVREADGRADQMERRLKSLAFGGTEERGDEPWIKRLRLEMKVDVGAMSRMNLRDYWSEIIRQMFGQSVEEIGRECVKEAGERLVALDYHGLKKAKREFAFRHYRDESVLYGNLGPGLLEDAFESAVAAVIQLAREGAVVGNPWEKGPVR